MSINNGSKLFTGNFTRGHSGEGTLIRNCGLGICVERASTIEYPASTFVTQPLL